MIGTEVSLTSAAVQTAKGLFTTRGRILGRHPEEGDFYNVDYFNGNKANQGIQFPPNGVYLDPHSEYQGKFTDILQWIEAHVKEGDVLDVGAGPGHLAYWAEQTQSPLTVYGCDISESLLRSEHNLNPDRTAVARIHQIPFASQAFGGVLFSDVLEHVYPEQAVEAVQEGFRILKPGGDIFIRIPNRDTWTDAALHDAGHVWLPTPDEVRELLEVGGFDADSISVFTRGFPHSNEHLATYGKDYIQTHSGTAICARARKAV